MHADGALAMLFSSRIECIKIESKNIVITGIDQQVLSSLGGKGACSSTKLKSSGNKGEENVWTSIRY